MKKKIQLKDIKVKSFVTDLRTEESASLKGGTKDTGNTTGLMTEFSCMAYISCNPAACIPSDLNVCTTQINNVAI